jgi:hypothetical protein
VIKKKVILWHNFSLPGSPYKEGEHATTQQEDPKTQAVA